MTSNTFTCAMCRGVFIKGWTEDEALDEMNGLYTPAEIAGGVDIICDECFRRDIEPAIPALRASMPPPEPRP